MKLTTAIPCLIAGIAIGWFARPMISKQDTATPSTASQPAPERPAPASSHPAPSEPDGPKVARASERPAKTDHDVAQHLSQIENDPKIKQAQEDMANRMTAPARKKFEARLAKLIAELNLTPEQQQAVRDEMEKRFTAMNGLFNGGVRDATKIQESMALLKTDGTDETLSKILQGDQLAQYKAVKDKEDHTKAESKALKDLSNVSSVIDDLTQDQKDAIYQAYNDQALKNLSSGTGSGMGLLYDGMGVQLDDELGMHDLMSEHMGEMASGTLDPKSYQDQMKEQLQKRIEDRVTLLQPHLTAAQLQQYRGHLEDKVSGMMGMFGADISSDSEVPTK